LATHRQTAPVPDASVAIDIAKSRDILLHGAPQLTLDDKFAVEERRQPADVVVGHLARFALGIDSCLIAKAKSQRRPNAVQIAQRNVRRFIRRNINTEDTRHRAAPLALALLVARVRADH
jgi:hypothetical protein